MGINPTPTNHRSFTFDGKSTREFGVYTTGKDVFNSPERAVEMISIPGRDGEYALDQGHFNNIEVTYRAGIVSYDTTDFAEAISYFRNWLASRKGYCRLTDEYNTEEYRMAVFKNAIALEHEGLLTGEFDVTFDCKPQRYLAIGEELVEIGAWGNTETAEGEVVTIEASSDTAVKALTADIEPIQDLNGYDAPWVGGAGKNLFQPFSGTSRGITFTVQDDGTVLISGTITQAGWPQVAKSYTLEELGWSVGDAFYNYIGDDAIGFAIRFLDSGGTQISQINQNSSGTVPQDTATVRFIQIGARGTTPSVGDVINTVGHYYVCRGTTAPTEWTPYENICPISGHTEVDAHVTGFNVWDEEWEVGYIDPNTGQNSTQYSTMIRSKNYVPIKPNTSYYFKSTANASNGMFFYDIGQNLISKEYPSMDSIITTPPEACYLRFCMAVAYGTTYNNDISINYPSTDTEYHAYNGQSYNTPLEQTVYGGTLDVVSGLLTVTHELQMVSGATIDAVSTSSGLRFARGRYVNPSKGGKYYCDSYVAGGTANNHIVMINSEYFRIYDSRFTDLATAKAILDERPIQYCYPLATPQTYQLTPQQIELLLGENNIFADSGNVTVEYGHNPIMLTNPTWFPSKPLLAVEGYGEVKFNNRSIVELDPGFIGEVTLLSDTTADEITLDESAMNLGDTITVNGNLLFYVLMTNTSSVSYNAKRVSDSITDSNSDFSSAFEAENVTPSTSRFNYRSNMSFDIVSGTDSLVTDTVSGTISCTTQNGATFTATFTTTLNYKYDASAHTISFRLTYSSVTTTASYIEDPFISRSTPKFTSVVGDSTKSRLGNPTYIDCDIGEAYMESDGSIVSLNQFIDLGSDLPTLPSGDTEVTYDNTITKVEVKPNWWKV